MSELHHVNIETGEITPCGATVGRCPYGAENHYTSREAAEEFFETKYGLFSEQHRNQEWINDSSISADAKRILSETSLWSANEEKTVHLLKDVIALNRLAVPKEERNSALEERQELMSKIAGLHFAKDALSDDEKVFLSAMEEIQKRWLSEIKQWRIEAKQTRLAQ